MIDIVIGYILPVIGSLFIYYAIFNSIKRIGTNLSVGRTKKYLIVIAYMVIGVGMSFWGDGIINLAVMLLVPVLGHYLYNNSRMYIVYYIGFIVVVYLVDIFSIIVLQILIANGLIFFINEQMYTILFIVTVRFIEFMALKILTGIIRKRQHEQITKRQMISSFVLPIFSIVNLFSMLYFLQVYMSEESMIIFSVNIAILVGLNIYFASVFDVISDNNRLENELNLYQQQQAIQARFYGDLEQKYDSTRKLIHDIRNHVQAMEHLYEEQKNPEGCQYAKDVHDMLNQLGQKYYTSNKMLNIILNDKVQTMQTYGILEDIKISSVDLKFIRDVDMTTLFSNILDNSIEAAKCSIEKQIILRVAMVHDFITITLKNSIDKEPVKQGNSFVSTKKDHEGLGLNNVERIVKKYKGDVQYEWGKEYFITRIMLTN